MEIGIDMLSIANGNLPLGTMWCRMQVWTVYSGQSTDRVLSRTAAVIKLRLRAGSAAVPGSWRGAAVTAATGARWSAAEATDGSRLTGH